MFKEFESEEHEKAVKEIRGLLGEFVIAFEAICASMRSCIHCAFKREGLQNQLLSQAVVNGQSGTPLRLTLWAVCSSLRDQDDDDLLCIKTLISDIERLTTQRNGFMHSEWHLNANYEDAGEEFIGLLPGAKTHKNRGPEFKTDHITVEKLQELMNDTRSIRVRLHKLGICLNQNGFKVSEMFNANSD